MNGVPGRPQRKRPRWRLYPPVLVKVAIALFPAALVLCGLMSVVVALGGAFPRGGPVSIAVAFWVIGSLVLSVPGVMVRRWLDERGDPMGGSW